MAASPSNPTSPNALSNSPMPLGAVDKPAVDFLSSLAEFSQEYAGYVGYPQLLANRIDAVHGQLDRISARKGEIETLVQLIDEENQKSRQFLPYFLEAHAGQLKKAFSMVDQLESLVSSLCRTAQQLEAQVKRAEDKQRQEEWSRLTNWKMPRWGLTTEFGDLEDQDDTSSTPSSPSSSSSDPSCNSYSKIGVEILDTAQYWDQLRARLAPQQEGQ